MAAPFDFSYDKSVEEIMKILEAVRGAGRRVGEVSLRWSKGLLAGRRDLGGDAGPARRTVGAGSNLAPFSLSGFPAATVPGARGGHPALPKPTPANLRRFAETPVARRAINVIKDRVAGMRWRIQARSERALEQLPNGALRARILTDNLERPNPDDSFRSFIEQVLEDVIVGGFGAIEIDLVEGWGGALRSQSSDLRRDDGAGNENPLPRRARRGTEEGAEHRRDAASITGEASATLPTQSPLVMWPVDGASIRIISDWDGQPGSPRYVQVTGLYGANGQIVLNDDELSYIRLNPRTHTPFGLGRVEVAFETINEFLSAHRYAGRLASNSVVQYALWMQNLTPEKHERLIRWWQDEIEGTGRVPIMSAGTKPEVLRFAAGNDADLRLAWQEFLIRLIADAFDLPAQFLGITSDVNRATAAEMTEIAFRSAIVPTARLMAEHLTRDVIGKKMGWTDLEFVFADVDAVDELQQAQIDEILLRNGVLTVNEVRKARGLAEMI